MLVNISREPAPQRQAASAPPFWALEALIGEGFDLAEALVVIAARPRSSARRDNASGSIEPTRSEDADEPEGSVAVPLAATG